MFTRESKILLIIGFVAILGVSILFVDHFAAATRATPAGAEEVDPLYNSDLVVSVLPTDAPSKQNLTDTLTDRFATGVDRAKQLTNNLTNSGTNAIDNLTDAIEDIREETKPLPLAQPTTTPTPTPPVIKMGQPVIEDDNGRPTNIQNATIHRVARGETLWGIAQRYYDDGSLHHKLAEFNADRLPTNKKPRTGATLIIPDKPDLLADTTKTQPPSNQASTPKTTTYTVKTGDSLSEISQATLGTSKRWREILELNNDQIKAPNEIRPGMTLKIPTN